MIINTNMAALNANNQMNSNQKSLKTATEKLSSGLRINQAADDAAGLAISEKMRGQIRGLNQASRNAQDGISYVRTAEGALDESQNILQRMREITVQAANDTNTEDDRKELQKEMNQLTSEINRIGQQTEFNTQQVLRGTKAEIKGDVNYGATTLKNLNIDMDSTLDTGKYKLKVGDTRLTENLQNVSTVEVDPDTQLETGDYQIGIDFDYEEDASSNVVPDDADKTDITKLNFDGTEDDDLVTDNYSIGVDYDETEVTDSGDVTGYDFDYTVKITNDDTGDVAAITGSGNRGTDEEPEISLTDETIGNFTLSATFKSDEDASFDQKLDFTRGANFGVDGMGFRAQVQNNGTNNTSDGPVALTTSEGGSVNSDWVSIENHGDNGTIDFGFEGLEATGLDASVFKTGNTDANFTIYQTNSATLVDEEGNTVNGGAPVDIEPGDKNVMANNNDHFEWLSFDVEGPNDIIEGEVEFDVYNPDEYHADMQIGANEGQNMSVDITDMRANMLGVSSYFDDNKEVGDGLTAHYNENDDVEYRPDLNWSEHALDVTSQKAASDNIAVLDHAINRVSSERSELGAIENRLEHTVSNLDNASENLSQAESRIRDADMANQMVEMTKSNILTQASQSMLAQANQQPQSVLQLLG